MIALKDYYRERFYGSIWKQHSSPLKKSLTITRTESAERARAFKKQLRSQILFLMDTAVRRLPQTLGPGSFSDSDEQLPEFRIYSYNEI